MDNAINFRMYQPTNALSDAVQAVWSVTVAQNIDREVSHWLPGDGGCGIIFNLANPIQLNDQTLAQGCFLQPISRQAHKISLPQNSVIVGIRFQPAVSYGLFDKHVTKPSTLALSDSLLSPMQGLHEQLLGYHSHSARLLCLLRWLKSTIDIDDRRPKTLAQAIDKIQRQHLASVLNEDVSLSQRQLERHFKKWLGMSAKHYQRIVRTRQALNDFRANPATPLVELAINHGFTDQAHMTREFKSIARITPGQYRKKIS